MCNNLKTEDGVCENQCTVGQSDHNPGLRQQQGDEEGEEFSRLPLKISEFCVWLS